MATDPQTLLAEGKCFLCFGVSDAEALELALLARKANPQKVNLVPAGSLHTGLGGQFQLSNLIAGHTYTVIFGPNETSASDLVTTIFATGTITIVATNLFLFGIQNSLVTAQVFA